jgi:hypothetical protein
LLPFSRRRVRQRRCCTTRQQLDVASHGISAPGTRKKMKKDAATRFVGQDVADMILRDRRSLDLLRSATWGTEDVDPLHSLGPG